MNSIELRATRQLRKHPSARDSGRPNETVGGARSKSTRARELISAHVQSGRVRGREPAASEPRARLTWRPHESPLVGWVNLHNAQISRPAVVGRLLEFYAKRRPHPGDVSARPRAPFGRLEAAERRAGGLAGLCRFAFASRPESALERPDDFASIAPGLGLR